MADSPCFECGGICCSFRTMNISFTSMPGGWHDLEGVGFIQLQRESGGLPDMEFYLHDDSLLFHCNERTEEGLCGIYEDRPRMCREWRCDVLEGKATVEEWKERVAPEDLDTEALKDVTVVVRGMVRQDG